MLLHNDMVSVNRQEGRAHLQGPVRMLNILVQLRAGREAVVQGRLLSEAQCLRLRERRRNAAMLCPKLRPQIALCLIA